MEDRYSQQEVALEIKSLRRIISAYLNYSDAALEDIRRYERSFKKLIPAHKALLSHLPLKYQKLRQCISVNSFFIMSMLQAFEPPLDMSQNIDIGDQTISDNNSGQALHLPSAFLEQSKSTNGNHVFMPEPSTLGEDMCHEFSRSNGKEEMHTESSSKPAIDGPLSNDCCEESRTERVGTKVSMPSQDWLDPSLQLNVPLVDVDKVRCIVRDIVRDWALEGQRERDQCYKPILEELDRLFPFRRKNSRPPSCLIPGAGLGRLALEISLLGFESQGNEFSYYMMICSNFILNQSQKAGEWTIHPWIHSNCNSLSDNDQLRPVCFPDIHPASAGITEGFSMCAGDFVEVYNDSCQEGYWDAVVTCFFLDTAHNIVEYIEIISRILKAGGVWINLGPLLYHFADTYGPEDEMSIELSLEDVKKIAFHYGFSLEIEKMIETTYTANPKSMMQTRYLAAFWTMKKAMD